MDQVLVCVLGLLVLPAPALAAQVSLAWDGVAEAAGYRVSYGTGPGSYTATRDFGNTTGTITGLAEGSRYYFAVQAYDATRTSDYSNEVNAVAVTPLVASFTANGSGAASVTVTQGQTVNFVDTSTSYVVSRAWDLGDGTTATTPTVVKTYSAVGSYTVTLSVTNAGVTRTASKTVEVRPPDPVADFTASPRTGDAPLVVGFTDGSTGAVDSRSWSFGDGTQSTARNPVHTYTQPGLYTVTLAISGPGGADTITRSSYVQVAQAPLPLSEDAMEAGEIEVDSTWQRVEFANGYVDPVVIALPLSANDPDPALVRVRDIDPEGFSIRVQEWDYLDGVHGPESVSYLVMERGYWQLPGGAWVEAGKVSTNATKAFVRAPFTAPFAEVPVVLASITSFNEGDAVIARKRAIDVEGFDIAMWEQEANAQTHYAERIDFIAWEPSFGEVAGLRFEAKVLDTPVDHVRSTLSYQGAYAQPPWFLADTQTFAGGDPFSLRWDNPTELSVDLWIAEEQSGDAEIGHVLESVGYVLLEPISPPQPPGVCATPCSLWDATAKPTLVAFPETSAVELGVKLRSEVDGWITGVRFYKSAQNTGTHVGRLWSSTGKLLAAATFTNETASGWQQVDFPNPVPVERYRVYVASYHAPRGGWSVDRDYFTSGYAAGPLYAPSTSESGGNGVYLYGSGGVFPSATYSASNYWVDAVFLTP